MSSPSDQHDGLPKVAPDVAEQTLLDEIDNIVPTRGYQMLPMVGLGGSAGGISALKAFFETMPADSGMVFVVILHLSPEHESVLAEMLQRVTSMRVVQVMHTEKVEANRVYVIPPGKILTSLDGYLQVDDLLPERGRRTAIDIFFRTLADTHGAHSAAIVLSGADSDGAIGIKRIKERGGLTIAQTPDESEHSGMPRAAIATGMVDWVLEVRDMPRRLVEYRRLEKLVKLPPEEGPQPAAAPRPAADEPETALRDVLSFLRTRTGRDFSYYKRATILRRIARRMQVAGVAEMPEYLNYLRTHPGEAGALLQDLLITVTNFFRDRDAFAALAHRIETLFHGKGPGEMIRVWVAACATGEEAYSVAMLLDEYARSLDAPPTIQVFATDLDEEAIRAAREGIYPETILADISEDRLRRYFVREHRGYRVRREIREMVLFAVHDLLRDSPFSRLDLITCRNLLIYLTQEAQKRAFDIFHFALHPGGVLFLGTSEAVDEGSPLFSVVDKKSRIYQQRPTTRGPLPVPTGPSTLARALDIQERSKKGPVIANHALNHTTEAGRLAAGLRIEVPPDHGLSWGEAHYRLIERFAPPSVLVDAQHEILHLSETCGRFLQLSGGEPTRNLLRLVHPMLRIELRAVLYRAAHSHEPAEVVGIPVELGHELVHVTIRVMPAEDLVQGGAVVTFETHPSAGPEAKPPVHSDAEPEPAIRQIERELERTKAHLRDTVEQYEASTEELKAGNEELQAMNEELRSATEELETSREELQSSNEELTTVNQELKLKVDELGRSNSDLQNLMSATEIGTIFLDRDFRITRYTPHAVRLFNLIPTDLGRPLSDLTRRLDYPELQQDAEAVLEKLVPVEREVSVPDGRWYLARLNPYRTVEDRIGGIVLTFVDITERKASEETIRANAAEFQAIFETSSVGMAETEPTTRQIVRANRKLCDMLGYAESELTRSTMTELTHAEDHDAADEKLERLLSGEIAEFSMDKRLLRKGCEPLWVHINVTLLRDADGNPFRTVVVVIDISGRKTTEGALRDSEQQLQDSNRTLDDRVRERTGELRASENRLRESAATASHRAEQLRNLAADLTETEQRERRRIALILHDHVQQMLVAARMRIDLVRSDVTDSAAQQRLDGANQCINDAITAARTLTVELVPPLLHDEGLPAALGWLASQFEEQHGLTVELDADSDANPEEEGARDLLFQAARELLLNVAKHAGMRQAWVQLSRDDGRFSLEVRDEGVGFDPARQPAGGRSFGLFHIRERAEAIGGALSIESRAGAGTRVGVTIPRQTGSGGA